MNKAETKNPDPKITLVRVHPELADEVKRVLPEFSKKIGFNVSFQRFVEKSIRECLQREKPKENFI